MSMFEDTSLNIDDILEDIKSEKNPSNKVWSIDEIDALIYGKNKYGKQETKESNTTELIKEVKDLTSSANDGANSDISSQPVKEPEKRTDKLFYKKAQEIYYDSNEKGKKVRADDFGKSSRLDTEDLSVLQSFFEKQGNPLVEGTTPDFSSDPEIEHVEEENEINEPINQISFEKTRTYLEFDPKPISSENMDRTIRRKPISTPDSGKIIGRGMESNILRQTFLENQKMNSEKTSEIKERYFGKTYETFGAFIKKPSATDGGLPKIVPAYSEFEHQNALKKKENEIVNNPDQLSFMELSSETAPTIISEEEAQDVIKTRRADKRADIAEKLSQKHDVEEIEDEIEPITIKREYYSEKDIGPLKEIFFSEISLTIRIATISFISFALLFVANIVVAFPVFSSFQNKTVMCLGLNFAVLFLLAISNFKRFSSCINEVKKRKPGRNTALILIFLISLAQLIVGMFYQSLIGRWSFVYTICAALLSGLLSTAEKKKLESDYYNFDFLIKNNSRFRAAAKIEEEQNALMISRGLMLDKPELLYSAKIKFAGKFIEMTKLREPADFVMNRLIPIVLILSVVVFVVSYFVSKNIYSAVSYMLLIMLVGTPVYIYNASQKSLENTNDKLRAEGMLVSGYEAAENTSKINAVVIDAKDLFTEDDVRFYGTTCKLFNNMPIIDAFVYAASMTKKAQSSMHRLFLSTIVGTEKEKMLLPVEAFIYEEKLGCSGLINNQRVLFGNRELLLNHNVNIAKRYEDELVPIGKQAVYLAVEGKPAAMFIVGHSINDKTKEMFSKIKKIELPIIVRTTDPQINDDFFEKICGLPKNFVKIMSSVAGVAFNKIASVQINEVSCGLIHTKIGSWSFAENLFAAFSLNSRAKIFTVMSYLGVALGVLTTIFLSFTYPEPINVFRIIAYISIMSVVCTALPLIRKYK